MPKDHILKSYDKELFKLKTLLVEILELNYQQTNLLYSIISSKNNLLIDTMIENEEKINEIDKELVQLSLNIFSLRNPLAHDLRFVFSSSHISKNAERIGDYIKNTAKKFVTIDKHNSHIEIKILEMIHTIMDMTRGTIEEIRQDNIITLYDIIEKDIQIDNTHEELSQGIINDMIAKPTLVVSLHNYLNVARSLERVGDHIVNICYNIAYTKKGKFD